MPRQQESRAAQRDKWRRTRRTGRLLHCPRAGLDRAELDRVGVLQGASRLSRCADSPRNGSQSIRSNGFRSLLRHARGARGARGAGRPDSQPDRPAAASRSSAACTRLNCRTEATLDETGRCTRVNASIPCCLCRRGPNTYAMARALRKSRNWPSIEVRSALGRS
jgi:hypothetical protein